MSIENAFIFNNLGGMRNDETDQTQRTIQNSRFSGYTLSNYSAESMDPNSILQFSLSQPTMVMNGIQGVGYNSSLVDVNSKLLISTEQERAFERLQLNERPFITVPYLGRGCGDPVLESQLQQGETIAGKKSVSTIMEKSFNDYSLYPLDSEMSKRTTQPEYVVQESALDGWVRGGSNTRTTSDGK
jgi:hypothetical protein